MTSVTSFPHTQRHSLSSCSVPQPGRLLHSSGRLRKETVQPGLQLVHRRFIRGKELRVSGTSSEACLVGRSARFSTSRIGCVRSRFSPSTRHVTDFNGFVAHGSASSSWRYYSKGQTPGQGKLCGVCSVPVRAYTRLETAFYDAATNGVGAATQGLPWAGLSEGGFSQGFAWT